MVNQVVFNMDSILLAAAAEAICVSCGCTEFVVPLDGDEPLEAAFLANYICDVCEPTESV